MKNVVLATTNPEKVREFNDLLASVQFKAIAQIELGLEPAKETGLTFVENAILKARHAAQKTNLPVISDDSGLMVNALGGAPGIYSARYAGDNASDQQNIDKLLVALKDTPQGSRSAQFYCALVYMRYAQDPAPLVCYGSWMGEILTGTISVSGFGYDPVFYLPELGRTAAELRQNEKISLSHRGKALKTMLVAMRNA